MHVRIPCVALAALLVQACSFGVDVAEWKEEVKLHDGTAIVVWRKARSKASGFPYARRGRDIDYELRYEPMKLYWKTSLSDSNVLHPLSLDTFDGTMYLVLHIGDRENCKGKAPLEYSAQFLRWRNGRWEEIPQSTFPVDRALINLYQSYWGADTSTDAKGLVTWKQKAAADGFYADRPDTVKSFFERGSRFCRNVYK